MRSICHGTLSAYGQTAQRSTASVMRAVLTTRMRAHVTPVRVNQRPCRYLQTLLSEGTQQETASVCIFDRISGVCSPRSPSHSIAHAQLSDLGAGNCDLCPQLHGDDSLAASEGSFNDVLEPDVGELRVLRPLRLCGDVHYLQELSNLRPEVVWDAVSQRQPFLVTESVHGPLQETVASRTSQSGRCLGVLMTIRDMNRHGCGSEGGTSTDMWITGYTRAGQEVKRTAEIHVVTLLLAHINVLVRHALQLPLM